MGDGLKRACADELPFPGAECPECGYFTVDEARYAAHVCFSQPDTLEGGLKRLIARWVPSVQQNAALRELADVLRKAR